MSNAIITSRFNSKRLPGKALMPLMDKPLLQLVVDNVREARLEDVIVATSTDSELIIEYCKEHGILCYAHDNEDDCLTRLHYATKVYPAEITIRIWGDCPMIDPVIIDYCTDLQSKYDLDYLYVRFVKGQDVAVFKTQAFQDVYMDMTEEEKLYWNEVNEHNCWLNRNYSVQILKAGSVGDLSIDTWGDLQRVKCLI